MASAEPERLPVQVAYGAGSDRQVLLALEVAQGCTAMEAVRASGLLEQCPGIALEVCAIAIHGVLEREPENRVLRAGDRVEVCRPLQVDPKEARRARAEKVRRQRTGR